MNTQKEIEVLELNKFVVSTGKEIEQIVMDRIKKFKPGQQVLLLNRVVSYLFLRHCNAMAHKAKEIITVDYDF